MFDYHNHSNFSDDGTVPMRDMVQKAYEEGLFEIAITDHFDPDYPDPRYPFTIDFDNYYKELEALTEEYKGKIKVVKGIEIGIQHGKTLDACSFAVNAYPYDFVLGSFHCAEGYDLCSPQFFSGRSTEASYEAFYQYMYDCLKVYKDYDVLGHFNVIDRYTDYIPDYKICENIIEEILKMIISDGKGLEINTSSYRYGLGERTTPTLDILKKFKALGGEIITTGSDAHRPSDLNHHLDRARELIKNAGLKYITTFDQRKPTFHRL